MSRLLEHQLSTAVGLRVSMLGEELPDDMPAGMIFDLVFFGHVGGHLEELEQGRIDIPEWERRTREIEQWMDNDPVVRAFEEEASKAERIPLASRTFLNLAQRQVRRKANPRRANQGIPNSQRPPNFSEGFACAQVLLASVTGRDRWERDLHPDEISQLLAEQWLTGGGLAELLSSRSPWSSSPRAQARPRTSGPSASSWVKPARPARSRPISSSPARRTPSAPSPRTPTAGGISRTPEALPTTGATLRTSTSRSR